MSMATVVNITDADRHTRVQGSEHLWSAVPIIVHSHLRWDFVWQRPQQILSRLVQHHPVLFLEEPIESADGPRLEIAYTAQGVIRAIPLLPSDTGNADDKAELVLELLREALRKAPLLRGRFNSFVQWFYSPMTAPIFLEGLDSTGVVYDCMDELANFKFAPPDIAAREQFLLAHADLVFTGGYSLYRSKSGQHRNTHFFGCGVDVAHFEKARSVHTAVPLEIASLQKPIIGYFGVIDERLDYELIDLLATSLPEANVVMVGPVAKVRQEDLPARPNIHWLGQRSYQDLPALVKGFDICLMPFALNAATQYINPTKTLEYLAAAKPVVSTAVADVVHGFSDLVEIENSPAAFVERTRQLLAGTDTQKIQRGLERARAASWDATVASMRAHVLHTLSSTRQVKEGMQA